MVTRGTLVCFLALAAWTPTSVLCQTSPDSLRARYTRLIDSAYNAGDLSVVDTLVPATFVNNDVQMTRDSFRHSIVELRGAFKNLHVTIDDLLVDESNLAARLTLTGTHTGTYMGHAASGKTVRWSVAAFYHTKDARVTERWVLYDEAAFEAQLTK